MLLMTPPQPPTAAETRGNPGLLPPNLPATKGDDLKFRQGPVKAHGEPAISDPIKKTALISASLWTALGNLLSLQDRVPWVVGTISLVRHIGLTGPGKVGRTDGHLDR